MLAEQITLSSRGQLDWVIYELCGQQVSMKTPQQPNAEQDTGKGNGVRYSLSFTKEAVFVGSR